MGIAEQIEIKRNERIETLNDSHKSLFGQYLTPDSIASFMSELAVRHGGKKSASVQIIDPGAGQRRAACERLTYGSSSNFYRWLRNFVAWILAE